MYFEQKTVPNRHDKKPQKKIMHPADPSQGQRKHLGRASAIRTIRQLDGPSSTDQGGWHLPSRRLTPLRQKVQPSNRKWKGKEEAQRSQIRTSRQNTRQQTIYLICGPILAITSTTSRKRDYEYNSSKSYFPPHRLLSTQSLHNGNGYINHMMGLPINVCEKTQDDLDARCATRMMRNHHHQTTG